MTDKDKYIKTLEAKVMELRNCNKEEDCTTTCPNMQEYEKQLQRKEQELKHLRATLKNKNIVAIVEEHDKLKQECEELKTFCDIKDELYQAKDDLHKNLSENFDIAIQVGNRYKQALEKIEEYTKTTLTMPLERKVILEIINEVKNEKV